MSPVTDETLRRMIGVMGTLLVVVVGATVLLVGSRGGFGGSNAAPSPSPLAAAPASPPTRSRVRVAVSRAFEGTERESVSHSVADSDAEAHGEADSHSKADTV